jgi:hypothetical protein
LCLSCKRYAARAAELGDQGFLTIR